jgi:integrase/recombinase XerD
MSIRKHPTQPGVWQIIVSQGRKGKQLVYTFECTEAEALIKDRQINAQIKGERMTVFPTIQGALPDYLIYYQTIASQDIVKDFTSVMRRCLLPHFGKYQAGQIIPTLVYSYTANRLKTPIPRTDRCIGHRTIQKELNYLSAMCRWMHVNGMADKMPVIPKPPKAKTRPQRVQSPLTMDELQRLLNAIPDDKKVLALLYSDAGLRRNEALNLRVEDVDLPGCRITVRGKGSKVVVYPILTERLQKALEEDMEKTAGEWLKVNPDTDLPYQSIKTLLKLASKRAGITKNVTHHTLRHTFSTLLMESGISTEVRRLLMRHSTLSATEHYTHVSPGFMQSQAGAYADMVNTSESLKVKK